MAERKEPKARLLAAGLEIILRYEPHPETFGSHDVFGCGDGDLPDRMAPDDRAAMEAAGWFVSREFGGWCIFV